MLTDEQRTIAGLVLDNQLTETADASDFPAVFKALTDPTVEKKDHCRWTYDMIREQRGDPLADALLKAVRAAAKTSEDFADAHSTLLNAGIRLDSSARQAAIGQLSLPDDLMIAAKELGVRKYSLAEDAGVEIGSLGVVALAWTLYRLDQRITNYTQLLREHLSPDQTEEEQAQIVSQAWSSV